LNVSIVRPSQAAGGRVDVCVVVDVLRATTTATILCHRLGELRVVRKPDDLGQLPPRAGGYALFSELSGVHSDIPRFDNSPVQARDVALEGRMPVLVTTNGTLAVGLAAQFADEVLLAGFINLSAVVRYIQARGVLTAAVMPAGNIKRDTGCIEDDGCAEAIASRLSSGSEPVDVHAILAACRREGRIIERRANEPNLGADIDLSFDVDAVPAVPRVVGAPDQRWFGVVSAT
jgi:phosphosulfolactate phosphohydrolase-like enzyme